MRFVLMVLFSSFLAGCATTPVYNPMAATIQQEILLNESGLKAVQDGMGLDQVHQIMGQELERHGQSEPAIAQYREALRLDPKLTSAWINLATALARDPASRVEARSALERAKALSPNDPRVSANLEELDAIEHGNGKKDH